MANPSTLRKTKSKGLAPGPVHVGVRLRPQNKKLLQWLDSWLATPDDRGEAWWRQFENDLESNRVTFRPTQAG